MQTPAGASVRIGDPPDWSFESTSANAASNISIIDAAELAAATASSPGQRRVALTDDVAARKGLNGSAWAVARF